MHFKEKPINSKINALLTLRNPCDYPTHSIYQSDKLTVGPGKKFPEKTKGTCYTIADHTCERMASKRSIKSAGWPSTPTQRILQFTSA